MGYRAIYEVEEALKQSDKDVSDIKILIEYHSMNDWNGIEMSQRYEMIDKMGKLITRRDTLLWVLSKVKEMEKI